jgi:hypothetical protein
MDGCLMPDAIRNVTEAETLPETDKWRRTLPDPERDAGSRLTIACESGS